jgi:anti-sigma regulatory factor (Ser/Thr protein kinase)
MTYLHCPRCRLAIRCRADYLTLTNCPRCLARTAIAVELFASSLTASELQARTPREQRAERNRRRSRSDRVVMLPRSPLVSVAARDAVRDTSGELGSTPTADASLLVSELATNAYRHGQGYIRLHITISDTRARFAVHDDGDGRPALNDDPGESGGWGLQLVDRVATRWGTVAGSSLVWFELDLRDTG